MVVLGRKGITEFEEGMGPRQVDVGVIRSQLPRDLLHLNQPLYWIISDRNIHIIVLFDQRQLSSTRLGAVEVVQLTPYGTRRVNSQQDISVSFALQTLHQHLPDSYVSPHDLPCVSRLKGSYRQIRVSDLHIV